MAGSNSVDFIAYYSKNWSSFSDDGEHIRGSCYGKKIFGKTDGGISGWERIKSDLRTDRATRRALLSFFDLESGPTITRKDLACITSIQFLIRNDQLNCIASLRSNDVIWGLCHDVFLITMLQERLACELGVALGWYEHHAASMHLYSRHYEMANQIASQRLGLYSGMPPMNSVDSITKFLAVEQALRIGDPLGEKMAHSLPSYWRSLANSLVDLYKQKNCMAPA